MTGNESRISVDYSQIATVSFGLIYIYATKSWDITPDVKILINTTNKR